MKFKQLFMEWLIGESMVYPFCKECPYCKAMLKVHYKHIETIHDRKVKKEKKA